MSLTWLFNWLFETRKLTGCAIEEVARICGRAPKVLVQRTPIKASVPTKDIARFNKCVGPRFLAISIGTGEQGVAAVHLVP